jgi:O-antigen ligase
VSQAWSGDRSRDGAWRGVVLIVVAVMTPIVAYLGNQGFAPLVAAAGLVCLPLLLARRPPLPGLLALLALVLWACASSWWSVFSPVKPDGRLNPETVTAVKLAFELALYSAFAVAALGLSPVWARRGLMTLGVGLGVVGLILLVEAMTGAALYKAIRAAVHQPVRPDFAPRNVARVSYVLALLFFPVALFLTRERLALAALPILAGMVAGAIGLNVNTPILALLVSAAVFLLVWRTGRIGLMILLAGVAAYFALAPLLVHWIAPLDPLHLAHGEIGKESWSARVALWRFAADRILERPLWGWGLDASRAFPTAIPLHTHDAAMQLWLELGLPGAALAATFFVWLIGRIDKLEALDRPAAAAAAASLSAYLVVGALSFGAWQEWWLALAALACVAVIAAGRAARS